MSGVRPFSDLRASGLLWLINRVVFHPRGFALALHADADGFAVGWSLLGDGTEPWVMNTDPAHGSAIDEDALFAAAEETLSRAHLPRV